MLEGEERPRAWVLGVDDVDDAEHALVERLVQVPRDALEAVVPVDDPERVRGGVGPGQVLEVQGEVDPVVDGQPLGLVRRGRGAGKKREVGG